MAVSVPLYQTVVLAGVAAAKAVAAAKFGPGTRCNGRATIPVKKSCEVASAEAPASAVSAVKRILSVNAALKLSAVTNGFASGVKSPEMGAKPTFNSTSFDEPSGKPNLTVKVCPTPGDPVPKNSAETTGGVPVGPVTVVLSNVDVTP